MRSPPSLPNAPVQYERKWADTLLSTLRLYLEGAARPGPVIATTLTLQSLPGASTLTAAITATQTTIPLSNASKFPEKGFGTIGNLEKFQWSGKSGNTLTGVLRGQLGTPATAFAVGAIVVATAESNAVYAQPTTGLLAIIF